MNEERPKPEGQRPGDIQEPGSGGPAAGLAGLPANYPQFLAEIKARIAAARTRAVLAVNSELIKLYWEIGRDILEREQREGWGSGVINRLASDLRREFPAITGFSRSNLHYMRSFAEAWPLVGGSEEIVQQPVGQLPWGQNIGTRVSGTPAVSGHHRQVRKNPARIMRGAPLADARFKGRLPSGWVAGRATVILPAQADDSALLHHHSGCRY